MYCQHCGSKLEPNSRFCTSCGKEAISEDFTNRREKGRYWTRKSSIVLILLSIFLTSLLWLFVYGGYSVTTEDEAINIMTHLLETVGRQQQAWDKTGQVITLIGEAFSEDCVYNEACLGEKIDMITTLTAEVEKEREEIDKLWSETVIGKEFESFFSGLEEKNQNKLLDVINIYFPEESQELTPSATLL